MHNPPRPGTSSRSRASGELRARALKPKSRKFSPFPAVRRTAIDYTARNAFFISSRYYRFPFRPVVLIGLERKGRCDDAREEKAGKKKKSCARRRRRRSANSKRIVSRIVSPRPADYKKPNAEDPGNKQSVVTIIFYAFNCKSSSLFMFILSFAHLVFHLFFRLSENLRGKATVESRVTIET